MKDIIESGKTALGIEFGSTKIKAVLIDENNNLIATSGHKWENKYENGVWTYSLDDIWKGLQDCYSKLAATVKEKYDSPEFKNAEESIIVDIPVKQYARLSTSNMDVMPDSMTVGSESNVMFGINNTGKVVLYNVTVNFEADSIKPTDYYVGNIKPGETGNVDTMLSGIAATADDGTVHVIINYEDENGQPAEPVEKELTLLVEEEVQEDWNMDVPEDMDVSGQPASGANNKLLLAGGGVAFVAVIAAIVFAVKFIKKRKEAKQQKDDENEIS